MGKPYERKAIALMYLFNNHEDERCKQKLWPVVNLTTPVMRKNRTFFEALTGEERPHSIAGLSLILVLLLHLWGTLWLLQPVGPITLAKPLMMEVSLVSASGLQPAAAPQAQPKPSEPVKPAPKPAAKKPVKKKMPVRHKQAELPKTEAVAKDMLPAQSPTESLEEASETRNESATSNATKSLGKAQGKAEPYTEASFSATYGSNPKPKYPSIARSRGWQGKVLLRVKVSAYGLSEVVTVQRSSGHEILDESAIAAVEKWQFIPAKRGTAAVACSVIVPIIFTLNN